MVSLSIFQGPGPAPQLLFPSAPRVRGLVSQRSSGLAEITQQANGRGAQCVAASLPGEHIPATTAQERARYMPLYTLVTSSLQNLGGKYYHSLFHRRGKGL